MEEITMPEKWDKRFLGLAEHVSAWSKDPSTKVGAVITDCNNRIISIGYNGFPKGVDDSTERLENREIKYKIVIHGERNALLFARRDLKDCKIYTWPFMPCSPCASMIIQSGISEVISTFSDNPRWIEDFKLSETLFKEAGVKLRLLKI